MYSKELALFEEDKNVLILISVNKSKY